jgi:putative ABC transport system ATP-binding protein
MMLELKNIYKTYNQGKLDVPVLKDISLTVDEGEYVAIMGPSGSGKTTLMNIIGCLDSPSSGEYFLEGKDIAQSSDSKLSDVRLHSIGFVFQSFYLLSRQSALDNVALPLLYAGVRRKERQEIARKALERVGLGDRVNFKPTQLSGGQCQRVAIARAIVNNPKVLLADEPTGALDTKSGEQIMEIFKKLNEEGVTIVMITHEPEIAAHAQRTLHIRDGRLLESQVTPNTQEPTLPADVIPPEDFHIGGKSGTKQDSPAAPQPEGAPGQAAVPPKEAHKSAEPPQVLPTKEAPKPVEPPKVETVKVDTARAASKGPRHAAGPNAPAYQPKTAKRNDASGPRHGAWAAPAAAPAPSMAQASPPAPLDKTAGTVLFEEVNALLEASSRKASGAPAAQPIKAEAQATQVQQAQQAIQAEARTTQAQRAWQTAQAEAQASQVQQAQQAIQLEAQTSQAQRARQTAQAEVRTTPQRTRQTAKGEPRHAQAQRPQRAMKPGGFGSPIPTDLGAFFPRPSRERGGKEKPLIPRTEY